MSKKIIKTLRKNSVINTILDELFVIKIWVRNYKAKPIRDKQVKEALLELNKINDNKKRIWFCGVPTHKNMGDQAQRYCIREWCKQNYPECQVVELPTWPFYDRSFCLKIKEYVKKEDIIIIQSGYCTTSRHYDHSMHRFIVKNFLENKILIMPQTVNFIKERDGKKTAKIYNQHKKLLFLARDKVSFEAAKHYFDKTEVKLYPDIVTTLIGSDRKSLNREGVLICVRNDGEKKYTDTQIEQLQDKFLKQNLRCEKTDTNSELSLNKLVEKFGEELEKVIEYFSSFEVVITDRYHGTIFSMISNTPVIVLATVDHKVKTGTEWFKGVYDGSYYNASSIENATELANKLLNEKKAVHNDAYFKVNYYDKLKSEFEKKGTETL